MKKCPFCAEEIQSEAIKCRYCGERLDVDMQSISSVKKDFTQLPWLFVGAYAQYSGTGKVPHIGKCEFRIREEVTAIDWNNNRWQFTTKGNVVREVFGRTVKIGDEGKMSEWLPIGELVYVANKPVRKLAEYESVVRTENLGVRDCIIQEYIEVDEKPGTILIFWDKELLWPLKFMVILRYAKSEKSDMNLSKEIGRIIQNLCTGSLAEINKQRSIWSIEDLKEELKKSKHPSLSEVPFFLELRETNIPGLNPM